MRPVRMETFPEPTGATPHEGPGTTPESAAELPDTVGGDDDLALLAAVRAGDMTAMSTLYERHHAAALRTARAVGGAGVADDLVSDAFMRVFTAVLHGSGPDRLLRPYLTTTIRHLYVDRVRKGARELLVGETEQLDRLQPDDSEALVAETVAVDVLATLPPRWREILWRTIIVGEPLSLAGARMGLNANAAAALSFRARGGLRAAYLARVAADTEADLSSTPDAGAATGQA